MPYHLAPRPGPRLRPGRELFGPFGLAGLGMVGLAVLCGLLASCAVGPDYHRPPVAVSGTFRGQAAPAVRGEGDGVGGAGAGGKTPAVSGGAAEAASLADQAWWQLFHDDALKALIGEALRNGYDVRLAAWRVEAARASARVTRSQFLPQVTAQGGWSRGRQSALSRPAQPGAGPLNLYSVDASASWELDVWGRIRRLDEAALAQYLATEEARRGVLLSLTAEVATGYFQLRALDQQLDVARRATAAFQETYDLFDRRLKAGAASALETSSAEVALAASAASVPNLERQIEAQENQLALLLGRQPGPIARGAALDEQALPPEIPAGLPSSLLERRPDLRAAEQQMVAANANVGVATANFFPTLSLTAAFGGVAPQLASIFTGGRSWSAGGGLVSPVLQGGRLAAERRVAVAQWEQSKVAFEQSVTNALAEVATALVAHAKLSAVEREQARAVAVNRTAVQLSNQRYRAGLSDYLQVLQAEQQQLSAENALAQTRFTRLANYVALYRALGGGWQLADRDWPGPGPAPRLGQGR
jgi:multidrug efflux system outer membrane protein